MQRVFESGIPAIPTELPVAAGAVISAGDAVGVNAGNARRLQGGDTFAGWAESDVDNSGGSAGDVDVRVRQRGVVKLTLAAVVAGDYGSVVYAADHETFTKTATDNTEIGKITRVVSASDNVAMVYTEALALRI